MLFKSIISFAIIVACGVSAGPVAQPEPLPFPAAANYRRNALPNANADANPTPALAQRSCGSIYNPCGGDPSAYQQCGGLLGGSPWPSQSTGCPTGGWYCACVTKGVYSQCLAPGQTTSCTTQSSNTNTGTQTAYGQCGGSTWMGPTRCSTSYTCTGTQAYFSACMHV